MNADAPGTTMRVLVVEDEPRLAAMLEAALRDMGFSAAGAGSAEEALLAMQASPHELMILDLRLPGVQGLDFFETVHRRWPETAVIVLTGFGDLDAARRAIRYGVVEFLTKPASLGEIEQALERARSSHLARKRGPAPPAVRSGQPLAAPATAEDQARTLEDLEREHILAALDHHKGNRSAAAEELGISLRTLYYRLAQYERQHRS